MLGVSQLSERFKSNDGKSDAFKAYRNRKYSDYGFLKSRSRTLAYNPEWKPEHLSKWTNDRYRWVENPKDGLRFVGKADGIVRLDHNGWYIDNFQDQTVHGEVWQLPARNGECIYVPGINDPNNDASVLCFTDRTEDKEECARWADSMAEKWAESEREYQAKESANMRKEEIKAEIETLQADFKDLVKEIRANCDSLQADGMKAIRKAIKQAACQMRRERRKLRAEYRKLEDNYWNAVPQY